MAGEYTLSEPGLVDDVYGPASDFDRRLPDGDVPTGDLDVTAVDTKRRHTSARDWLDSDR